MYYITEILHDLTLSTVTAIRKFVCHCGSRYVGPTSQRLEERIKQHIPKSIANRPIPNIRQSLPHPGKATNPHNFTNSPSANILLTAPNPPYITIKTSSLFSLELATPFHLSALEATFFKSLNPLLCKQKEFVFSLKIS